MRVRIRLVLALHRISKTILLGLVTIAMVIPGGNVALSQGTTGSQAIFFTAIDLTPIGFVIGFTGAEAYGISGGQQVGRGWGSTTPGGHHALLWSGSASSAVDLTPFGITLSWATGTSGKQQVGWGEVPLVTGGSGPHALLWSGTAASMVDLNPSGFSTSFATGVSGGEQVGWGYGPATGNAGHALLWHDTAASMVDLNPSGFLSSRASGTSGGQQVGYGDGPATGNRIHALLWRGTAASAVDLNPSGFVASQALGISEGQIVGLGATSIPGYEHALWWRDLTASSTVDLNPSGVLFSRATATSRGQQVGSGAGPATGDQNHALLWNGSASSVVDLHSFLPPGFVSSFATGIDATGNIVGYAWGPVGAHAFLWKPDPRLTVPRWYQAGIPPFTAVRFIYNNWGSMQLDTETGYDPNANPPVGFATIAHHGCALTALTMVYNFWAGNFKDGTTGPPYPGVPPANPADLKDKTVLNNAKGLFIAGSGQVTWSFAQWNKAHLVKMYQECPGSPCDNTFSLLPQGSTPSTADPTQTLVNILRNKVPVILPIQCDPSLSTKCNSIAVRSPGRPPEIHWVVVTGFDSTANGLAKFLVNDPGEVRTKTLADVPNAAYNTPPPPQQGDGITPTTVQDSLNNLNGWKVYTNLNNPIDPTDPISPQALGVYSDAPVELTLTDPMGRRTGFDPATNGTIQQIPTSDYSTSAYCDELGTSGGCNSPFKTLEMANQIPGQYTLNVIGTGSGPFTVSVRASDAAGNLITQTYSGTTAPGVSSQFTFQGTVSTFASFGVNNLAISPLYKAFGVDGTLTLGPGGTISPVTQPVTIELGNAFLATIPAGSFTQTPQGTFIFGGVIQGVLLAAALTPTGGNSYAFAVAGAGAPNLPSTNPVDVGLATGSNGGSTSVNAIFVP